MPCNAMPGHQLSRIGEALGEALGEPELVDVVGAVGLGARRALAVSALQVNININISININVNININITITAGTSEEQRGRGRGSELTRKYFRLELQISVYQGVMRCYSSCFEPAFPPES